MLYYSVLWPGLQPSRRLKTKHCQEKCTKWLRDAKKSAILLGRAAVWLHPRPERFRRFGMCKEKGRYTMRKQIWLHGAASRIFVHKIRTQC